ncbi:MAG: hypothetical protein IT291_03070 [Deltaproteobacteria bacterium]|nr:hypothetical protein [Deltaproteobacteria bacterium]
MVIDLTVKDELEIQLNGAEIEVLPILLKSATHFMLINSFYYNQNERKKKKLFKKLFIGLEILLEDTCEYYCITEWPGTVTHESNSRLMVYGAMGEKEREFFKRNTYKIFETYANGWDDLTLLKSGRLLFFNCTHEGFGSIFGSKDFLERLPLKASVSKPEYTNYRVVGEIISCLR